MKNNFNIGERIHDLRIESGLSQEQLALRADITPTYLGLIERNIKNPTIKVIEQLCNALNISLAAFFDTNNSVLNSFDPISLQILIQLNDRTPAEKQLILQLIKIVLKFRHIPD